MSKKRVLLRIGGALVLTGVLILDAFHVGALPNGGGTNEIKQAGLLKMKTGHKWYDQQGNFKGCVVPGDECVIFYTAFGELTLSSEGIEFQ